MQRVIYEVYAKVVDATGAYNTLSGYPKAFDSKNYGNDLGKTFTRAEGEYHSTIGEMCKNDARQVQSVILMDCNGNVRWTWSKGQLAELPDANEEE